MAAAGIKARDIVTGGVLAQLDAAATTEETLYTVPTGKESTGRLSVCNRSASAATYRVRIKIAGAGDDNKQWRYYDQSVNANTTVDVMDGDVLGPADVLKTYSSTTDMTFMWIGTERVR